MRRGINLVFLVLVLVTAAIFTVPLLAGPPIIGTLQQPPWQLPTHAKLYVIGDSWASGLYADPNHTLMQVAAEKLGWQVKVDAVPGTGYLNDAGLANQTYGDRTLKKISGYAPDVIIVQGGSNDITFDLSNLTAQVLITVAHLHANYPNAHIVLLGPGPDVESSLNLYASIDQKIQTAATQDRIPYISIMQQQWITAKSFTQIIDTKTGHPSVAGHAYLGQRLATALTALTKK